MVLKKTTVLVEVAGFVYPAFHCYECRVKDAVIFLSQIPTSYFYCVYSVFCCVCSFAQMAAQTVGQHTEGKVSGQVIFSKLSIAAALLLLSLPNCPSQSRYKRRLGASSSVNLYEGTLHFHHFFLDVKRCFARVWRKTDKCQRLIAKLWTEQQGSGETKQRKWHSVVETLSCSDSYHSGHHELTPGCLMHVSEPKEHLSVTSAISVCEGFCTMAARPCQS